jgi:hypothetical protein
VRDITLVLFPLFSSITQYIFFNPPYNLTSSLYFKAYKNGYKELAFIVIFLLLILYILSLNIIVFILISIQRSALNICSPLQYY